jgi:hypothetical protein
MNVLKQFEASKVEVIKPNKKRRPRQTKPFVVIPIGWAEAMAKATKSPEITVMVELLRRQFETHSNTFTLPNKRLAEAGVSREVKRRVLLDLECVGLITVERSNHKGPRVTLLQL